MTPADYNQHPFAAGMADNPSSIAEPPVTGTAPSLPCLTVEVVS